MRCCEPGCAFPAHARGLCHTHYMEYRRSPAYERAQRPHHQTCPHCGQPAYAGGLCQAEYMRQWRKERVHVHRG